LFSHPKSLENRHRTLVVADVEPRPQALEAARVEGALRRRAHERQVAALALVEELRGEPARAAVVRLERTVEDRRHPWIRRPEDVRVLDQDVAVDGRHLR